MNSSRLILLLVLAVLNLGGSNWDARGATPRPNIIFIMADDLGYSDPGCYGGEIRTPHLDQLAARGLPFTRFYNEAKCSESRAALMTGSTHHTSRNLKDRSIPTLAELMRNAGYRTLMAGKWHLADTPIQRGFDRYFGFLNGAVNFWTGVPCGRDKTMRWRLDDEPFEVPEEGFYTTDAFTDYAIDFIEETLEQDEDRPFFLYLAHNAPHYPLHAWPEDIERYMGDYSIGWDQLRKERFGRMKKMGVIPEETKLSKRDPNVPAWEELTSAQKEEYALLMTVYAAMVDRLDQNIGRLMQRLEELGIEDNTLVLFCSDNGGCPYQNEEKPDSVPGGPESHRTYNTPWANASNTPFRLYKRFNHEGGTSTPLIAYWPNGIQAQGAITRQVGHLVDVLPTCLQLAGAAPPKGIEGVSLVPALRGETFDRSQPLFWEFMKHRAVRVGDWKLVAQAGGDWSLHHMTRDRMESKDLSKELPVQVEEMALMYDAWARMVGAPSNEQCRSAGEMGMRDYTRILGD